MPREKEDRDLIDHLGGVKRAPVSGSAVVMILVARSSGACPAAISSLRAAVTCSISARIRRAVRRVPGR